MVYVTYMHNPNVAKRRTTVFEVGLNQKNNLNVKELLRTFPYFILS